MIKKLKELWNKYQAKIFLITRWLRIPFFAILIGFLGSYAGSHGTSLLWRRCGIPVLSMIYAYITIAPTVGYVKSLWLITIMSLWGAMAMGYGIPDEDYPENPNADSGSDIGRFWTLFWRKQVGDRLKAHRIADYFTRGSVAIFKGISLLSIPLLKGNWVSYGIGAVCLVLSDSLIGWRGWGSFKIEIFGKQVEFCWSDIVNYTVQGIIISCIITFNV